MDPFFRLLSSMFLFIIVGANHDSTSEPLLYWRTMLPHTPMPTVIAQLLQPGAYAAKPGTSVNVDKGGVNIHTGGDSKPPYTYTYNYAATDTQLRDDPTATLFFLRGDLRPGKKFALQLTPSSSGGRMGFIPRGEAEAIPFSSGELPSVLSRFGIAAGSGEAEAAESTVRECEEPAATGEKKLCATSLEAMVDFATGSLATRLVVAVGTEGAAEDQRELYEVERVRRVGGDQEGALACHPKAYAYAVFSCHATEKTEAYEVELEAVGGGGGESGGKVKAVAVCHKDTAGWNPKHMAFRVLKVKPGTVPVCHFLPPDHVVWAAAAPGRV